MASSRARRSGQAPQRSGETIAAISRLPNEHPNLVLRVTGRTGRGSAGRIAR